MRSRPRRTSSKKGSLKKRSPTYFVVNSITGHKHSKKPLSKTMAMRQMRALYAAENGYVLRSRAKRSSPYNVRASKRHAKSALRAHMVSGFGGGQLDQQAPTAATGPQTMVIAQPFTGGRKWSYGGGMGGCMA